MALVRCFASLRPSEPHRCVLNACVSRADKGALVRLSSSRLLSLGGDGCHPLCILSSTVYITHDATPFHVTLVSVTTVLCVYVLSIAHVTAERLSVTSLWQFCSFVSIAARVFHSFSPSSACSPRPVEILCIVSIISMKEVVHLFPTHQIFYINSLLASPEMSTSVDAESVSQHAASSGSLKRKHSASEDSKIEPNAKRQKSNTVPADSSAQDESIFQVAFNGINGLVLSFRFHLLQSPSILH